jgi:two-component system LytT family response regulator
MNSKMTVLDKRVDKRLQTIIVDDEPLALQLLRSKLNKLANINIIAECKNGREAIAAIHQFSPDLVFIDIEMPGIDGFGVIKKLQADIIPLIIFTTAYQQYAIKAFDVHAVDYILKPIDEQHIQRAISRAVQRFTNKFVDQKYNIIDAINTINKHALLKESQVVSGDADKTNNSIRELEHKIVIKDREGMTLLKQSDIEWVDAAGDYTCLHVGGVTHIKRCPLKNLLTELDSTLFKQVHRSTIVNLNYIKKVIPHTKGEYFLVLGEYDQIKVSRSYRQVIKNYLAT